MTRTLAWAMAVIGGLGTLVLVLFIAGLGQPGPVPISTPSAPQVAVASTAQAPLVAAPPPPLIVPTRESGNYTSLCVEQWTKRGVLDNEMYRYCVAKENEGYAQLVAEINANRVKDYPWLSGVVNTAVQKWTKRNARQDSMVAYEIHNQLDAFLNVVFAARQPGYQQQQMERCYAQWNRMSVDWTMVEYCYKQATGKN
jgi:hypothetical protein